MEQEKPDVSPSGTRPKSVSDLIDHMGGSTGSSSAAPGRQSSVQPKGSQVDLVFGEPAVSNVAGPGGEPLTFTPEAQGGEAETTTASISKSELDNLLHGEELNASKPLRAGERLRARRRRKATPSFVTLASATNDDPWGPNVFDRLGVAPDAKAFARLVASKKFIPPLAVGVFGRWGAGKSFFMRLVHDHVERLSEGEPSQAAPEADRESFHGNIVQIRFNAWHYVETNLWASLVDHLFSQLAIHIDGDKESTKLLDKLGTARALTIEAAEDLVSKRKEHQRAKDSLSLAQSRFDEASKKVLTEPALWMDALTYALLNNPKAKGELDAAAKELGLPQLQADADAAANGWKDLEHQLSRGSLFFSGLAKQFGSHWVFVAGLLVLAPFAFSWLLGALRDVVPFLHNVPPYVAAFSAALAGVAGLLGKGTQAVKDALDKLHSGKTAIDQAAQRRLSAERSRLAEETSALDALKLRVDQAQAEFQLASARLAEATEEFHGSTGGERLIRFIRTRAADGHYAAHLGLVASVRRDLEELSRGLEPGESRETSTERKTREALAARVEELIGSLELEEAEVNELRARVEPRPAVPPPFSRLILYIDDLDRCPAEKVVEVLQAVHMLLAFRLFVVFVAVDVRWVSHALETHHPGLLATSNERVGPASPSDYLEKIFQVPYWVRNASGGSRNLIASMLPSAAPNSPAPSPASPPPKIPRVEQQALDISPYERELLERMAPYVADTPRKVLWLVNVYRLVKANDDYGPELMTSPDACMAFITQLALVSREPGRYADWLKHQEEFKPESEAIEVVQGYRATLMQRGVMDAEDALFVETLLEGLSDVGTNQFSSVSQSTLLNYAWLARRYSFSNAV